MKSMTESELFFIDTNVLIYAYDKNENSKRGTAEKIVRKIFNKEINAAVSNQSLAEFVYVVTKKNILDFEHAKTIVHDFLNFEKILNMDYSGDTVLSAIKISKDFSIPFWDSLIAATMGENHIYNIYTENTRDFKVPWINAINPFK